MVENPPEDTRESYEEITDNRGEHKDEIELEYRQVVF